MGAPAAFPADAPGSSSAGSWTGSQWGDLRRAGACEPQGGAEALTSAGTPPHKAAGHQVLPQLSEAGPASWHATRRQPPHGASAAAPPSAPRFPMRQERKASRMRLPHPGDPRPSSGLDSAGVT